ncbi:hypothetical protein DENIT_11210 [Pseudomonas veronii]|nr:hypothetical protein DENIT_11210 [Pseudomonas veronii]
MSLNKHMELGLDDRDTPAQSGYGQLGAVTGAFGQKQPFEVTNLDTSAALSIGIERLRL